MKKILFAVLVAGLLQGCVVAGAAIGGGAVAGGIATEPRSWETIKQDENITYLASNLLTADKTLANQAHVSVVSYNRVVLLTGQAPTPELREQAVKLVKQVQGIKRIFNQITIGSPVSALKMSQDAGVTANIKARMLATTNLKSNSFKIVTEDGTVFILGVSTRKQGDIAATVARDSTGVKRVVKLIEYIPEPTPEK